jgi:RTX calcium-binding nonapeptide repeat (4 copies)
LTKRGAVTLVSLLVLILLPMPSARAHDVDRLRNLNPSHYNGDDRAHWHVGNEGRTNEAQIGSDAFDGVDQLWTMRAVATPEALYYDWYECNTESDPFDPATCRRIARDPTPVLSTPPPGVQQVAVFEATLDIPSNLQFGRTFRTLACIDGPPPVSASHCASDRTGVHFDDGSSTADHQLTDAGQITQPAHGQAVPNAGFTAVAMTSQSDIGRILFCLDEGTNPFTAEDANPSGNCDPGSVRDTVPDDSPMCTPAVADADCWEAHIDPPDDSEFSLGIVEQDDPTGRVESGAGDCEGDTLVGGDGANTGDDCQLDKIYLTSVVTPPSPGGQTCPGFGTDPRNHVVGTPAGEKLQGSKGADVICGLGGKDVIRGKRGKDVLLGGAGPDRLFGGPGKDLLKGGPGRDRLNGGPGRDRCRGGPGQDSQVRCER